MVHGALRKKHGRRALSERDDIFIVIDETKSLMLNLRCPPTTGDDCVAMLMTLFKIELNLSHINV
jgi:hypothetical protein